MYPRINPLGFSEGIQAPERGTGNLKIHRSALPNTGFTLLPKEALPMEDGAKFKKRETKRPRTLKHEKQEGLR
jgi:hypothetical protein